MRWVSHTILLLTLGLLPVLPACAENGSAVTILISRSTNTPAHQIEVMPNGSATYDGKQKTLPPDVTEKLFASVQAAMPLGQLKQGQCMKSASFGTKTTIMYNGDRSPDISCPGSPQAEALYSNVQAVETALTSP